MPELSLHFEVAGASSVDLERTADNLQEHLLQLPGVENADAVTTGGARLTGAEVIAGIAVGVTLVSRGGELIEGLRKLIEGIKKLGAEFSAKAKQPEEQAESVRPLAAQHVTNIQIINVVVDVGFQPVPLSELTEDDLQELARMLEAE